MHEGPIDLGVDLERAETHVLYLKIHFYKGKIVWFSMEQSLIDRSGTRHQVGRIDCCDGEIHRHVFDRSGQQVDRKNLVTIPVQGHNVVHSEYERYYGDMIDNWEQRVRTWRSS